MFIFILLFSYSRSQSIEEQEAFVKKYAKTSKQTEIDMDDFINKTCKDDKDTYIKSKGSAGDFSYPKPKFIENPNLTIQNNSECVKHLKNTVNLNRCLLSTNRKHQEYLNTEIYDSLKIYNEILSRCINKDASDCKRLKEKMPHSNDFNDFLNGLKEVCLCYSEVSQIVCNPTLELQKKSALIMFNISRLANEYLLSDKKDLERDVQCFLLQKNKIIFSLTTSVCNVNETQLSGHNLINYITESHNGFIYDVESAAST